MTAETTPPDLLSESKEALFAAFGADLPDRKPPPVQHVPRDEWLTCRPGRLASTAWADDPDDDTPAPPEGQAAPDDDDAPEVEGAEVEGVEGADAGELEGTEA